MQGFDYNLPPQYPYKDETLTDPPSNYFAYRGAGGAPGEELAFTHPMSGQCKFSLIIEEGLIFPLDKTHFLISTNKEKKIFDKFNSHK